MYVKEGRQIEIALEIFENLINNADRDFMDSAKDFVRGYKGGLESAKWVLNERYEILQSIAKKMKERDEEENGE